LSLICVDDKGTTPEDIGVCVNGDEGNERDDTKGGEFNEVGEFNNFDESIVVEIEGVDADSEIFSFDNKLEGFEVNVILLPLSNWFIRHPREWHAVQKRL
jgi:hypothetical protein